MRSDEMVDEPKRSRKRMNLTTLAQLAKFKPAKTL